MTMHRNQAPVQYRACLIASIKIVCQHAFMAANEGANSLIRHDHLRFPIYVKNMIFHRQDVEGPFHCPST